ncbi:VOC family protein [Streptomyces sp. NPDC021080]|uniref:VOC family protein n=1 Tax=Streptomyces sp. NPDC021080 TaxID=3365110 RepID=UPI0037A1E810
MPPQMKLAAITLDCPDPLALAAFYQRATGLEPHPRSNPDFAGLDGEHGLFIGFQRVDGHRAPSWPGQTVPQQLHLCFTVDEDLDTAEARLLELGAGKPDHQPHGSKARVLTDPAGHPFCITTH